MPSSVDRDYDGTPLEIASEVGFVEWTATQTPPQGRVIALSDRTVTIEINQQQEEMLDRLIAEGDLGSTHGEVVRSGFVRFCESHPEILEAAAEDAGHDR